MSCILSNGYVVTRVEGGHVVNGEPTRSLVDSVEKVIVVTDDGSRDELVSRTAEAVDASFIAEARKAQASARESSIEVLHALTFRKAPLIPETGPRLPFGPPSGA